MPFDVCNRTYRCVFGELETEFLEFYEGGEQIPFARVSEFCRIGHFKRGFLDFGKSGDQYVT